MGGSVKRANACRQVEHEVGETTTTTKEPGEKPLRPAQCRAYMRRALAAEFKTIVSGFVKGATSGSCQHVKLATELLETPARKRRAPSGRRTIARWLDEVEKGGGQL